MSATPTTTRSLPRHPSEEFLHKEAKRVARADDIQLADAQRNLAHEYGYRNWAELMAAVVSMKAAGAKGGGDANPSQPGEPPPSAARGANIFPMLPLRGLVTFPHVSYPVFVGRPASIKAVRYAVENQLPIVMVTQKDAVLADISASDLYEVGVIASVVQMLRLPDGTLKTVVEGQRRARVSRFILGEDYSKAEAAELDEPALSGPEVESQITSVISAFMTKQLDKIAQPEDWGVGATTADQASVIADRIASRLSMDIALKQVLLELIDPVQRLEKLLAYLNASG